MKVVKRASTKAAMNKQPEAAKLSTKVVKKRTDGQNKKVVKILERSLRAGDGSRWQGPPGP